MKVICLFLILLIANTVVAEERSAEQIYNTTCVTCHSTGVANAPKTNEEAEWKARNKSIAEFVASSKKGLNAMPPMGLCTDCSDKELKKTIEFMMKKK